MTNRSPDRPPPAVAPSDVSPPSDDLPGDQGVYLVVLALGLLAAVLVAVQLWADRSELRMILTQAPV